MSAEATEQKRVEAALSESEERFYAIFSQTAVGIAQIGLDGTLLLLNNRLCEMILSFAIMASARSRLTWNDLGTNNRSTCQPFSCLSFDSSDSC
jgi:hypothetical protein